MKVQVIDGKTSRKQLAELAGQGHGEMVKAVVDLQRMVLAVGGELHADAEAALLERGSQQQDLWGINLYPSKAEADRIEYTSLINIRPRQGNLSMEIADPGLRERIRSVVNSRVNWD